MEMEPLAVNTSCHGVIYGSDVKDLVKILRLHLAVRACRLKTYLWTEGKGAELKLDLYVSFFFVQLFFKLNKKTNNDPKTFIFF